MDQEINGRATAAERNPIPNLLVQVLFPSREVQFFTTDENGRFSFYPVEDGVYVYFVPGRTLSRSPSTNVFAPSATPFPTPAPSPSPTPSAPPTSITNPTNPQLIFFTLFPLLFIIIIFAMKVYIYSKEVD